MTYKQALYFIGKCLSLFQYPDRRLEILNQIEKEDVSWPKIVKVSTGHMVLPALYLNLKRADLLNFLPTDLVTFFEEVTQLNRIRNKEILKQAQELNTVLLKYNIEPVFLKGTAHLLENLYRDIAERMVGDIDFLVAENQIEKAANLLINEGYKPLNSYISTHEKGSKHYPRLTNQNKIAAVEIHWAITLQSHKTSLNYQTIFSEKQFINNIYVPLYSHQAIHNVLNTQVNDKGFLYGKITPRQLYDGYLLAFKPEVIDAVKNYKYDFYKKTIYLNLIQKLIKNSKNVSDTPFLAKLMMLRYDLTLNFPKINRVINWIIYLMGRFISYPKTIIQACYKREYRRYIYSRLSNPKWYKQHLKSYKKTSF